MIRGLRGATTVLANHADEIFAATQELLNEMVNRNHLETTDIISGFFTLTADLNAAFPATAARDMGWTDVPMVCSQEIPVPGALPQCIRVLLHIHTDKAPSELSHVYLRQAVQLRPDLVG